MIKEIQSSANPVIKQLRNLATSKKVRQQDNCFLLETSRALETLLEHGTKPYAIKQLFFSDKWSNADLIRQINTRFPLAELIRIPDFLFEKITDTKSSQEIVAVVKYRPEEIAIDQMRGHYLLLDGISDPGNLGTMIRTAAGAGFSGVLLINNGVEPHNPKVVRSTMGMISCIALHSISEEQLDQMIARGYELAVTSLEGSALYDWKAASNTILVIGSEAHGASRALLEKATQRITIPLDKRCESLNAAVAAGICMFHLQHYCA
jgi:RNA methyltransferase, TrmH family